MKILTISPDPVANQGDFVYRIARPFGEFARQFGAQVKSVSEASLADKFDLSRYDLIYIDQSWSLHMLMLVQLAKAQDQVRGRTGPKIVVDVNDAYEFMSPTMPAYERFHQNSDNYDSICDLADAITTSSPLLAKVMARRYRGKPVSYWPNGFMAPCCPSDSEGLGRSIDCYTGCYTSRSIGESLERYQDEGLNADISANDGVISSITCGIACSDSHVRDLLSAVPAVSRLIKAGISIPLLVMCSDQTAATFRAALGPDRPFTHVPAGTLSDYMDFWARCTHGLVFVDDTPFNQARSDIKPLEMLSMGCIPLFPDYGPYRELAERLPECVHHGYPLWALSTVLKTPPSLNLAWDLLEQRQERRLAAQKYGFLESIV
jgi:hypothetical protein